MKEDEERALLNTLENLMSFQERLEKGLNLAIQTIRQLDTRIKRLEQSDKRRDLAPAILNSHGERVN